MNRPSLNVIWQRDLSRPRYRTSSSSASSYVWPREFDWICALLRDFPLRHHKDDHFGVEVANPLVILDGHTYDPAQVKQYLRSLRLKGHTVGLLHIGDEFRRASLSVYDDAAFVYRNYWRPEMESIRHCHYLPLGVNCDPDLFTPVSFSDRAYRWSFAGQAKGSREAMATAVASRSDGRLVLNADFNSGLPKAEYAQLLTNTQVVLCPRGFISAETYRLYEALEAGAIPLVEDDGGIGLLREHVAPSAMHNLLRGGPSYWYDLARRTRWPSYWRNAFGSDFPCPRIYRWENVQAVLDRTDLDALAESISTWWSDQKAAIRSDLAATIYQHLRVAPTQTSSTAPLSSLPSLQET